MNLFTQILIFAGLMLSLIVILQIFNINLNEKPGPKVLLGTALIVPETKVEGMESQGPNPDLAINMSEFNSISNPDKSFCSFGSDDLQKLESQCNTLTKDNCSKVSCCGYLNGEKCVNGNQFGPTYRSEKNGKTINIDTYYYMNKCLGPGCPKKQ
jgi:hypothetical protein